MTMELAGLSQEMLVYLIILLSFGFCCCCVICCIFYYHYQVRIEMMDLFKSLDKNAKTKSISLKQQIKEIKQLTTLSPSKINNLTTLEASTFEGTNTDLNTSPLKILQLNRLRQLSNHDGTQNNKNSSNNNNLNTPKYKSIEIERNSPFSGSSSSNLIKIYHDNTSTKVNNVNLRQKRGISPPMNSNYTNTQTNTYQQQPYFEQPNYNVINKQQNSAFSPSQSYDNTNIKFMPNNQITPPIIISHNISNNMSQQQYMSIYNNPPSLNAIRFNNWKYNNIRPQIIPSNSKSKPIINKQMYKENNNDSDTNESDTPTIPDNNNDNNNKNINIINNNNKTESETERFPSRKISSQPIFNNDSFNNNNVNILPAIPPTETATEMKAEISESDSITVSSTTTSSASEVTKTKTIQTPNNILINIKKEEIENELKNDNKSLINKNKKKFNNNNNNNKGRLSTSKTPMPTIDETIDFNEKEYNISLPTSQSIIKLNINNNNNKRNSKSNINENTIIINESESDDDEFWSKNGIDKDTNLVFDEKSPQSIISPLSMPIKAYLNKNK